MACVQRRTGMETESTQSNLHPSASALGESFNVHTPWPGRKQRLHSQCQGFVKQIRKCQGFREQDFPPKNQVWDNCVGSRTLALVPDSCTWLGFYNDLTQPIRTSPGDVHIFWVDVLIGPWRFTQQRWDLHVNDAASRHTLLHCTAQY